MSTTEPNIQADPKAEPVVDAATHAERQKPTAGLAWLAMFVMAGALALIFLTLIYSTSNARKSVDGELSTYSSNLE